MPGIALFIQVIRESYPFLKALAAEKWNIRPATTNQKLSLKGENDWSTANPNSTTSACLLRPLSSPFQLWNS